MSRSSNFRSSVGLGNGSQSLVQRQSVQEMFQRELASELGTAMGGEATFPEPDAHRPSFATYFPAPAGIVLGSENDDVE
jgi:hypothetical protein